MGVSLCKFDHASGLGKTGQCRECQRQARARYNARNRESINEKSALWRSENRERFRAIIADWKADNKDKTAEATRARQAGLKQRTPAWADRRVMSDVYAAARTMTRIHGIQYHVDHILPLHGKNVSGLHVFDNLQILRAAPNMSKGNRY